MHFVRLISDWNSLESVRRAHSELEFAALAFFALLVVCDVLAHLSNDKARERLFEKIGLVFFAVAVLAEIVAYPYGQRNDTLAAQIIGSLDVTTQQAKEKAQLALDKSSTALFQASDAGTKANGAKKAASSALHLARGARMEADSFEKGIKSAKEQATKAESDLAEALRQAANAQAELNRLKTPRSLINASAFVSVLQKFKGTEYTFSGVFADEESINLLKEIDSALQLAGWKRVKPQHGFPAINVYGTRVDFPVVSSLQTGIHISIERSESLADLESTPDENLPANARAAEALSLTLSPHLSPPQEGVIKVNVVPGASQTLQIDVGNKR